MKVIVVNDFAFVNGGASQVAVTTAKLLAKKGHQVIFFSAVGPIGQELKEVQNLSVVCLNQKDILRDPNRLRAVFQGLWNFHAAKVFSSILSDCSPGDTIIHIHAISKSLSSSIISAAKNKGFRIIYHLHDYGIACPNLGFYDYQKDEICPRKAMGISCMMCHCDSRSVLHKGWRVLRQFVQYYLGGLPNDIDAMIYISEFSRRILKPYFAAGQRLFFLSNLLSVERAERIQAEKNQVFLFVGRFAPEKAPDLFARAVARLSIPAVFIGAGECEAELRKICPEAEFPGWLSHEDVMTYYSRARALVFPSKCYEGQPLTVLEAKSQGVPAIVADACAGRDEILDGETGLLFKSGSLDSLCCQIEKIKDDTLVAQLSESAYQSYWEQEYDEDAYVFRLEEIYRSTLSGISRN